MAVKVYSFILKLLNHYKIKTVKIAIILIIKQNNSDLEDAQWIEVVKTTYSLDYKCFAFIHS